MDGRRERGFNTLFGLSVEDVSIYDDLILTHSGEDFVIGQSMHSSLIQEPRNKMKMDVLANLKPFALLDQSFPGSIV